MMHHPPLSLPATDILVLGAGVTGLLAAIALGQAGWRVRIAGILDPRPNARTVALLDGSVTMFSNLGIWDAIAAQAAPLDTMRIIDDTGSLFAAPPVDFAAREIGLEHFGYNVALPWLNAHLGEIAKASKGVELGEVLAIGLEFRRTGALVHFSDGTQVSAQLVVGADGRKSLARLSAGIAAREWSYPQAAITAVLAHGQPHQNVSSEFQTRSGPCTLVPLPPGPQHPHRSSLVWLTEPDRARTLAGMDDGAFAGAVQRQTKYLLGPMQVEGVRGHFPMRGLSAQSNVGPRLALVGEAAHVFPPIGAQGLNLGLRDVADLAGCLTDLGRDPGSAAALAQFSRLRQTDTVMRSMAVDAMNRSLLTSMLPVDFLRGAGLMALAQIGPLRRAVMRAGVQPHRVAPLMRRQSSSARI